MPGDDKYPSPPRGAPRPLGSWLVERHVVDDHALHLALHQQPVQGERLGSIVVGLGLASERDVAGSLAAQQDHPVISLSTSTIDLAQLNLVPRVIAERERLLPIAMDHETLTIAVSAIGDRDIFSQVMFAAGRKVRPVLALDSLLAAAIPAAYAAVSAGEQRLRGRASTQEHAHLDLLRPPTAAHLSSSGVLGTLELPPDESLEAPPPISEHAQILVVEDDEAVRMLLVDVLGQDGHTIVVASNGREAVERLRTLRPQVVVLDAMLPEVHGFEICRTIKENPVFAQTAVVMVSAVYRGWQHARDIQEVYGADAFIEKPFDVQYLRNLVARMLGRAPARNALPADWAKKVKSLRLQVRQELEQGELARAEESLARWRSLDPLDPHAFLLQGNLCLRRGDLDGGMQAYEKAATFGPTLFGAFKNLGLVYDRLGFRARALQAWYRAAELAPDARIRGEILDKLRQKSG